MAILEVHDGYGRVERKIITQDRPILFGSSPKCEIVLTAMGVEPFHGRIRWKGDRYKLDAYPEVESLSLNGQRIKSASLRQGDEIAFGPCRIFMIQDDDGDDQVVDDRTREAPPPAYAQPAPTSSPPRASAATPWLASPMAPPSVEGSAPRAQTPLPRSRHASKREQIEGLNADQSREAEPPGRAKAKGRKLSDLFTFKPQSPDDDQAVVSPMVVSLGVALAIIVVLSWSLWTVIQKNNAQRLYAKAVDELDTGDFRNSVRQFDQFLEGFPKHTEAEKARVLREMANVRQYTSGGAPSWNNALEAAEEMTQKVGDNEFYVDSRPDLAEQVLKIAEGLADRARELADAELVAKAEAALALHGRISGESAKALVQKSQAPNKIAQAKATIQRIQTRTRALASMDAAAKAGKAAEVYAARDQLLTEYADLSGDKDVISRLTAANDLIRKAVNFDESARPGETEPRPEILGPPISLVLRDAIRPAAPKSDLVYALVDGLVFGIDGSSGTPLWQKPVGLASPFPPVAVPGPDPSILVVDSRYNELVRINGRSGKLIWRQELGEVVSDPPLILGNQAVQPLPSGKLLLVDINSGGTRGSVTLGKRIARSPVTDENGQLLYVLAEEDVLFVLTRDTYSCVAVEYVGHQKGSIGAPPARVGRYLVVVENKGIDTGRWLVYLLSEDGTKLKQVQDIPIGGWTWSTPASAGSVIWSMSDRGEVAAYSVGLYDAKVPFTLISKTVPEDRPVGPSYGTARSDREFWISSSRSGRYNLNTEQGRLVPAWTVGEAGPSRGPIQVAGKLMVLTQQNGTDPGVALWGIDPNRGSTVWKTTLGAPWPVLPSSAGADRPLEAFGPDGAVLPISSEVVKGGGFLQATLARPAQFRLPTGKLQRVDIGASTLVVQPGENRMLVREDKAAFQPIELPAPTGVTPLAWGTNLLIPSIDSRVYLIDPRSGAAQADPFMPPYDKKKPVVWLSPVLLDGDAVGLADTEGRIRRLTRIGNPRPRLEITTDLKLDAPLAADPASTGPALIVLTTDNKVRSLSARDLGAQGAWMLEAPALWGPKAVGGRVFLGDAQGRILAFGPDGSRQWTSPPSKSVAEAPPLVRDGAAWFLGRDGKLFGLSLDDGSLKRDPAPLGVLPLGPAITTQGELLVPTGWSSLRRFDVSGG